MDALKAEIERKRKAREEPADPLRAQGKKWVRRGEIEAQEAERYRESQRAKLADKAQPSAGAKAASAAGAAAHGGAAAPAAPAAANGSAARAAAPLLSDLVVQKRLRTLGEPIALFGEEGAARHARYLLVADRLKETHNADDDLRKGQLVNERQKYELTQQPPEAAKAPGGAGKADEEGAGAALGDADAAGGGAGGGGGGGGPGGGAKSAARCELLVQLDGIVGAGAAAAQGGALASLGAEGADARNVMATMHVLLSEWAQEIDAAAEEERRSVRHKQAALTFAETVRHLRPLVQQLLGSRVPADLLQHIVKIFAHVDARRYKDATDAYILAAIGNAAWPIGVTMVGIHSRSAREKIQATHSAHVMNDETQRKYLTGVKRLITFAQKAHPTLPSQMVLHWNYDKSRTPETAGVPSK